MKLEAPAPADAAPSSPPPSAEAALPAERARGTTVAIRNRQRRFLAYFFERTTDASDGQQRPQTAYECRYCHEGVSNGHWSRNLLAHLRECPRAPVEVTTAVGVSVLPPRVTATHSAGEDASNEISTAVVAAPVAPVDVAAWTADVVRLFFESNLPLQVADAPSFRSFFGKWMPGRALPSAQELLDRVYSDTLAAVIDEVNTLGSVAMVVDASMRDSTGAITVLLTAASRKRPPLYWVSVQLDSSQPRVKERFENCILEINRDFRSATTACRISGILTTSSASRLGATWGGFWLQRAMYAGPSPASVVNSLLRDVINAIPTLEAVRKSAGTIVQCIVNRSEMKQQFRSLRAWFYPNERDRRTLSLSMPTHPRKLYECVKGLHANKSVLKQLFPVRSLAEAATEGREQQDGELEAATVVIHTKSVWKDIKLVLRFLDPIAEALAAVEADSCPLSEIYQRWRWLLRHEAYARPERALPVDVERIRVRISSIIRKWGDQFQRSAVVAAFMLDPTSNTAEMNEQELDRATLEAMSFANDVGTCSHFGIHSRTFYSALRQFNDAKLGRPKSARNASK